LQFTGEMESFKEVQMTIKSKNICDADWKINKRGDEMNPGFICTLDQRKTPSGDCYVSEFLIVL